MDDNNTPPTEELDRPLGDFPQLGLPGIGPIFSRYGYAKHPLIVTPRGSGERHLNLPEEQGLWRLL